MDLRNKKAFSLAEMMVVMLILSIVLAASMPIITKRNHTTVQLSQLDVPIGTIIAYAGAIDTDHPAPAGWLLCNGQSIASAVDPTGKYAALRSLLGANTTPDLRGRVPVGKDDMGDTAAGRITKNNSGGASDWAKTLGNTGGEESHTLVINEMPKHFHYATGCLSGSPLNWIGYLDDVDIPSRGRSSNQWTTGSPWAQGGDAPHNNIQPSLILNYIIKY